ncbi:MAG: type I pantothenate kinase [Alicyclobacillus sp.]|nr:type I pantothenate kinase [Alicyclobacillus sp.]
MESRRTERKFSPYLTFSREEWRHLRASTPLPLTEAELTELHGINEKVSIDEVEDIYLPLSRLLNLYVAATQNLYQATNTFLGHTENKVPYIIGIAGSVAVGKSTTARIIRALLARWPNHPKVDLVTTDGFLYPNRVLEERGLMKRKGFPESYDVRRLIQFVADVKSGKPEVWAPVYSHLYYDIVPGEYVKVCQPDIVILEGLNVLQTQGEVGRKRAPLVFVSDFFDFSIYVDACETDIKQWYIDRFLTLRDTAFRDERSYFRRYAELTEEEAIQTAHQIWEEINAVNLRENIAPTRNRAQLILEKARDHSVQKVYLRKL